MNLYIKELYQISVIELNTKSIKPAPVIPFCTILQETIKKYKSLKLQEVQTRQPRQNRGNKQYKNTGAAIPGAVYTRSTKIYTSNAKIKIMVERG